MATIQYRTKKNNYWIVTYRDHGQTLSLGSRNLSGKTTPIHFEDPETALLFDSGLKYITKGRGSGVSLESLRGIDLHSQTACAGLIALDSAAGTEGRRRRWRKLWNQTMSQVPQNQD